jgi:hypothetical protein
MDRLFRNPLMRKDRRDRTLEALEHALANFKGCGHSPLLLFLVGTVEMYLDTPHRTSRDYYELSMSTTLVVMSSVQYYGLNSTHDNQCCTHQT